jgi:hypothetical protein
MPRKAKRVSRAPRLRRAATVVLPFIGLADVLALLDVETWTKSGKRSLYRALMYVAFAALAACARVRPQVAAQYLLANYKSDSLKVKRSNDRSYPVILLPVVVAVIEAYLACRRELKIKGKFLFVKENGKPLHWKVTMVYQSFYRLARRSGHHGLDVIDRLIGFYDLQLSKELREPAACVVLRHGFRGTMDNATAKADVLAVLDDRVLLSRVLSRNHGLSGPAGRWTGGHGRTKAKAARVFTPPTGDSVRLSAGAKNDPVCKKLLGLDWRQDQDRQRRKIIAKHLPYLLGLLDAGTVRRKDLRYLLNCDRSTIWKYERRHRRLGETQDQKEARENLRAEWGDKAVALYRQRPPGERPGAFFARIVREADYPLTWIFLLKTLKDAGLLPAQAARKSRNGERKKSEKSESRSRK